VLLHGHGSFKLDEWTIHTAIVICYFNFYQTIKVSGHDGYDLSQGCGQDFLKVVSKSSIELPKQGSGGAAPSR